MFQQKLEKSMTENVLVVIKTRGRRTKNSFFFFFFFVNEFHNFKHDIGLFHSIVFCMD